MKFLHLYPNHSLLLNKSLTIHPYILLCNIEGNRTNYLHYNHIKLTKIYDWDAANYTSGNWIDSVGNRVLTKTGSPTLATVNNTQAMKVSYNNYFSLNMNDTNNGLNLGDVWRIDLTFMMPSIPTDNPHYFLDFGSLATAPHAFAIDIMKSTGMFNFNAKLDGNTSNSTYNISNIISQATIFTTISLGMERYSETNNILYAIYNNVKYYSPNSLLREKATFNRNFNTATLYVGRGQASNSYQTTADKYIKSIKIYSLQ